MNIYLQFLITLAILLGVATFSYHYLVLSPQQQGLDNCVRSYDSEYEDYITQEIRVSPVNLCENGYNFAEFMRAGKIIREQIRAEYADPDNYWIKDDIEAELSKRLREQLVQPDNFSL